ncbi:atrial natriuretic peptide receptor 1-like, partial [Diaphorina citri]|uniref:guanylate cyclase n=1 Tax=Diaphorina citri TaxID=121845 RepID=A0A3Q0JGW7_DIACI
VKKVAKEGYNFTFGNESVSTFVTAFYDAVILYSIALNETIAMGGSQSDGSAITRRMWNRTYQVHHRKFNTGIFNNVTLDTLLKTVISEDAMSLYDVGRQVFVPTAFYKGNKVAIKNLKKSRIDLTRPLLLELKRLKDLHHDHLVKFIGACLDPPHCCLLTEYCPKGSLQDILENEQFKLEPMFKNSLMHDIVKNSIKTVPYAIVSIVLSSLLVMLFIASAFIYRHYKLEAEIASMTWKVQWRDISPASMLEGKLRGSFHSLHNRRNSQLVSHSIGLRRNEKNNCLSRIHIWILEFLLELKRLKDLHHDHLVKFIGACLDPPHCCLLTEYCPKGSLQDILENEQFKLEPMFKNSLMNK